MLGSLYSEHVWGVGSALFRAVAQTLECQVQEPGDTRSQAGVCSGICLLQFSGTWFVKAVVCDKNHGDGKRPKKMFPMEVTALEGGNLEIKITFQ